MSFGFKGQKGKSSPASPVRRSEGGSRLRNPGHAQVSFDSVGTYVSPYREPSSDLGRSYFLFFTPARTSDLLYTELTFPRWAGSPTTASDSFCHWRWLLKLGNAKLVHQ